MHKIHLISNIRVLPQTQFSFYTPWLFCYEFHIFGDIKCSDIKHLRNAEWHLPFGAQVTRTCIWILFKLNTEVSIIM